MRYGLSDKSKLVVMMIRGCVLCAVGYSLLLPELRDRMDSFVWDFVVALIPIAEDLRTFSLSAWASSLW